MDGVSYPQLIKARTVPNKLLLGTAHITQWQMNSEEHGTGGAYEIDLIVYDGNGMFISGFNRGKASGSPGSLKLTALPSTLTMDFTGLDDDPIKMNYDGESWECPGDNCKMGAYDSGKREGDFGFTCKNLPEADGANVESS
ncbi:hypothetical protein CC79DRAFT_1332820 [Sarocladium strictum]